MTKTEKQSSLEIPAVSTPLLIVGELTACLRLILRVSVSQHNSIVNKFVGAPKHSHCQQLSAASWLKIVLPWSINLYQAITGELSLQPGQPKAKQASGGGKSKAISGTGPLPHAFWGFPTAIKVPWDWSVPMPTTVPSLQDLHPTTKPLAKKPAAKAAMLFADSNDEDSQMPQNSLILPPIHDFGAAVAALLGTTGHLRYIDILT